MNKKIIPLALSLIVIFSAAIAYKFLNKTKAQTSQISSNITTDDINVPATKETSVNINNNTNGIAVLYYHSVRQTEDNELIISPDKLKEQLQFLKDQGYVSLTLAEAKEYILNNKQIPEKSILITFDDGYMDNYSNAFPILKELNMKATIFCIGSHLDGSYYLSEDAIKELVDYGIDIQGHTVNHDKLSNLTYEDQLKTLKNSKEYLEKITHKEVFAVAYPFGQFNDDTLKAAKESGYSLGFVTDTGMAMNSDNPLKLKRIYISSQYDFNKFKSIFSNVINKSRN